MRTIYTLVILVLLAIAVPAAPAHAGGVVTVCDEAQLLAALAGGGTVTFECSGTITLTNTISIAADTTIDGSGQDVTISGNDAVRVFDVPPGVALHLAQLTVANGNASLGAGVFVDRYATLSASNVTFADNTANGYGGGVYGGAIHTRGTLTVTGSTFSGNSAGDGGGIYNAGGTVHISDSSFTGNSTHWYLGGGIYNHWGSMTVATSTFSGNSAYYGAGILNGDGGWLTVSNCLITGNNAYSMGGAGGGIANYNTLTVNNSTFLGNTALDGGGLRNYAGTVTLSNSTFTGNSAGQVGGGIMNNPSQPGGTMTIGNSTFTGNSAGPAGGGLFNYNGNMVISNSTFSGNSAGAGGGAANLDAALTLKNTIVANSPLGDNCSGVIDDGGGNLSYPDTSCPGANVDPLLGPLQDNGGPTQTMALGSGSGAIDAGNDATCAAAPINNLDQRGVIRPWGAHCDIGAVEQIQEPSAVSVSALRAQSLPGTITPTTIAGLLLLVLVAVGVQRRPCHIG
jgi:hypothetical protein